MRVLKKWPSGYWFIGALVLLLSILSPHSAHAVNKASSSNPWETAKYTEVNVKESGSLGTLLWNLDADVYAVRIKGQLNNDDLRYIVDNPLNGIKYLDISGIDIIPSEEYYYEKTYIKVAFSHTNEIQYTGGTWLGAPLSTTIHKSDGLDCLFRDKTQIEYIKLPTWITHIGVYAFDGCENLCHVDFNDKITAIGKQAFSGTAITTFSVPKAVRVLDDLTFSESKITKIVLNNVDSIGKNCFAYTPLSEADLSHVTRFGSVAFAQTKLKKVVLSEKATWIPQSLFSGCSLLSDVTLPSGLRYIGRNAFASTPFLNNKKTENGVVYFNNVAYCMDAAQIGSTLAIKEGTTTVAAYFCRNGKGSVSARYDLSLPKSLKYIDECAFQEQTYLHKVTWGANIEYIGEYAFERCTDLGFTSLPEHLEYLGTRAFRGCIQLSSVTFPENLTYCALPFDQCENIKEVNLQSRNLKGNPHMGYTYALDKVTIGSKVESVPNDFISGVSTILEFEPRENNLGLRLEDYCFGSYNKYVMGYFPAECITYVGERAMNKVDIRSWNEGSPKLVFSQLTEVAYSAFDNTSFEREVEFPVLKNLTARTFSGTQFWETARFQEAEEVDGFYNAKIHLQVCFPKATKIAQSAFYGTTFDSPIELCWMTSFPNVTEIGSEAFSNCKGFHDTFTLREKITYLGRRILNGVAIKNVILNSTSNPQLFF